MIKYTNINQAPKPSSKEMENKDLANENREKLAQNKELEKESKGKLRRRVKVRE
jgi:hypothetical protein